MNDDVNADVIKAVAAANGYLDICEKPDNGVCAVMELMFTCAIISDIDMHGYGNRWCYHSYTAAKQALEAWDGTGEPTGWHRHPPTGRRVDEKTGEIYVNF